MRDGGLVVGGDAVGGNGKRVENDFSVEFVKKAIAKLIDCKSFLEGIETDARSKNAPSVDLMCLRSAIAAVGGAIGNMRDI